MDISMLKRLKKIKEKLNKSLTDISSDTDLSIGTLSNVFWGKNFPNYEFLRIFVKKYRVNLNWLINGEGDMFLDGSTVPEPKEKFNTEREIIKDVITDLLTDEIKFNQAILKLRLKK
jgi:transcriptional regulator with XRE-family HTH domain